MTPPAPLPSRIARRLGARAAARDLAGSAVRAGFTLIEMVLAIAIFALLIAGIFSISTGALELSTDLAYAQDRALMRQNLVEFFRKSFRSLPGGAEITLTNRAVGGAYYPTLRVQGGGTSFSPGHSIPPEASIEVYVEERPGGYQRIGVRLLDKEQTEAAEMNREVKTDPAAALPLLETVSKFQWRLFHGTGNQWRELWRKEGRPLFAELTFALDDKRETRAVFWIPPVQPAMIPGAGPVSPPGAPGQPGAVDANGNPVIQTPVVTPPKP